MAVSPRETHPAARWYDVLLALPLLTATVSAAFFALLFYFGATGRDTGAGFAAIILGPAAIAAFLVSFAWFLIALVARRRGARGWVASALRIAIVIQAVLLLAFGAVGAAQLLQVPGYSLRDTGTLIYVGLLIAGLVGIAAAVWSLRRKRAHA